MERSKQPPNVDRLSVLPDEILCHILSFLPTKSSAATSILARRWRYLWADVPTINLYFFRRWNRSSERPRTSVIFNTILLGHTLKALNTFRLKHTIRDSNDKLSQRLLKKWVAAVIARGKVQNIELHFGGYIMKLPECLLICKSLVDLRLHNCEIRIPLPASISFPCLEKLHLGRVKFNDDETFQHLISGCSVLEELTINDFVPRDLVCCRIFSPTLKGLTIDFRYSDLDHSMEIITPALRYLKVKGISSKGISAKPLSSLSETNIELDRWKDVKVEDDVVYSGSALEFLDMMPNVRCLKFDIYWYEFLTSVFSSWSPRFHNLTKLEMAADWRFILKFLEMADNLQVLIVNRGAKNVECWVEPQQVFTCLLCHLRSIVINDFCCKEHEYSMVRYLLKNAKVLMSMKICCKVYPPEEKFVAVERISLFERASEACKLKFC